MGRLRRLPYGANYLRWEEMGELREAIDQRILFRFQTEIESCADRLERLVAERLGTCHALAVHNCTGAIRLALLATQPSVGEVVYIPSVTFVAVAGAVLSCGLIPVMVDVTDSFALDADRLPSDAQRVIVAHMEGHVGPVPRGVPFVIEDCAQALGGRHASGRPAGTDGYAGTFSFHHNKVLTSGEGGLVVTDDAGRARLMRRYHDHGCRRVQGEYPAWEPGSFYGENLVSSEEVAAIQLQQFRHLDEILEGLERGYQLLKEEVTGGRFIVRERPTGDVKLSLRVEFSSERGRDLAASRLREARLPHWTLDRYFLPTHPVLLERSSIFADGFPWSLSPRPPQDPAAFNETRERLARTLCLCVSPEVDELEQKAEAQAFAATLAGV